MILSAKPTPARAERRASSIVGALALVSAALTGCTPGPEPTPTPTPAFTSEAEAFAAAEEVYRAYNDAVNRVDLSDPSTFELVYRFLTDEAKASTTKALSEFHADKVTVSGTTSFDSFVGVRADTSTGAVVAALCVDVSEVHVVDSDGRSIVDPNRPPRQPMTIKFEHKRSVLRISEMSANGEFSCD